MEICYNYWDGSNTLFYSKVKISTTIGVFLDKIQKELSLDHSELRQIPDEGLIYVVFDTIIPNVLYHYKQHLTFYDIVNNNIKCKDRPLFILKEIQNLKSTDKVYNYLSNIVIYF